jgi:hypothetical protein
MDTDFDQVVHSIFGKSNPFLCKWENLKQASAKRAVRANFRFHTNHFKSLVKDKGNNFFFQTIINIKYYGGLVWMSYYLFTIRDFWFLLTIPISFLLGFITDHFWNKRWLVTLVVIAAVILAGKYFELNTHYYYFLTFIIAISSLIKDVYNTFLTQLFFVDPKSFVIGVDKQYIKEIYDGITGVKHRGPFLCIKH